MFSITLALAQAATVATVASATVAADASLSRGLAQTATSQPPMQNCTLLPNKDRLGFDMGHHSGVSVDACPTLCSQDSCSTWTWNNYNGGTCWLKSYPSRLIDKAGVTATDCVDYGAAQRVCNAYTGRDVDIVGNDIGSARANGPYDCCDLCNEFAGCKAFAWSSYNSGTCWFKSKVTQVVYKQGVAAASIVVLRQRVSGPYEANTDYVGNDVANEPAKDVAQCLDLCNGVNGCGAYTWSNHNGGTCWLKSGKGETVSKPGAVSAQLVSF